MNAPARLHEVTLDDKYTLDRGRAFMTGTQALVRLPMLQRTRDLAAGLNTGGFISGYRGSPIGGFDQALWRARKFLDANHIKFQPGVNEDLAATSIWGTQQVNLFPDAKYDGVFAMWYGKGPGVDRCGDVFKHANSAGTSKHGGVLVLAGDDHAAKSSTLAHQSEHVFKACCIPVLNASSVQEYLDLGLHGFAISRFSGCWVAFKCVTDVIESGAVVEIDPQRVSIVMPPDFAMPPGGLNIRWPDGFLEQEARLLDYKVYAALAYCRANRLDRIVWDSPRARLGIVTTGKSFGDTLQALADLGIDERVAADAGIRLYKVAMSWPLEPLGARRFAEGLEEILVVEEKRQVIEYQIKEELYNWREGMRPPRVVGKFDDNGEWSIAEGQPAGNWLLPAHYELSAALIAKALANRFAKLGLDRTMGDRYRERVAYLEFKEKALAKPRDGRNRLPFHGAVDGPQHGDLHAHGRRGRSLDRTGALHRLPARVRQYRRRDLFPFGIACHPRRGGRRRQHDLQDPLQRRGGDDRRPARRRSARPGDGLAPDRRRGREADRGGAGREGALARRTRLGAGRDDPPARGARRGAARVARSERRVGDHLRADLRDREAPPQETRRVSGSAQARGDQRARLRGLRRLQRQVELSLGRAARDRVRPQAHHQPVLVQQGLLLPQGILPELRHGRRRQAEEGQSGIAGRRSGICAPAATGAERSRSPVRRPHHGNRRHGRDHHRPDHGGGGAPGGQGRHRARHERPRAEVRAGDVAREDRALARGASFGAGL